MELRPYQIEAINSIRQNYVKGIKKVLLVMPTGTGKTLVFSAILKSLFDKGTSAIMIVRGKKLVDQASQKLIQIGVEHGVIQANHWNKNHNAKIQICSIDTLYRRSIAPPADLVIIDEAHLSASKSFEHIINRYPDAFFLPVTATPNIPRGLRHVADTYVQPITFSEAVEQGYLNPPRYYAPTKIDLSNVKTKRGDYDEVEAEHVMDQDKIYGDIIEHWKRLGRDKPTICFCTSVKHSKKMVERFHEAGITAAHMDANTKDKDRQEIIEKLENGVVKIITNVGVLTTGVDIPCIENIIFARPTKSYNLYIQMIGRPTRLYPGKEYFNVLDHANNVMTNGYLETDHPVNLDPEPKKKKTKFDEEIEELEDKLRSVTCLACYGVYEYSSKQTECPYCGSSEVLSSTGERDKMEDLSAQLIQLKFDREIDNFFIKLKAEQKSKNHKRGWLWHRMKIQFGEATAAQYVPKRVIPPWIKRKAHSVN